MNCSGILGSGNMSIKYRQGFFDIVYFQVMQYIAVFSKRFICVPGHRAQLFRKEI